MRHLCLLSFVAITAGCSGNGITPGNDMSVDDLAGVDIAGGGHDLSQVPQTNTGTKLVGGLVDNVVGVTSDDYVIYYQGTAIRAVPIAGGTPKVIDADSASFAISGKTVLSFSNASAGTGMVTLTLWSSTSPVPKVISTNSGQVGTVSADGTKVAYQDNVSATGTLGDIYIANSDGTGAQLLVTGATVAAMGGGCTPELRFTPTRLLVGHCPDPGDAGSSVGTLSSYLIAGGGAVDVATNLQTNASGRFFSIDNAGVNMVVFDTSSNMLLAAPDGTGTHPALDPAAVLDGYVLGDGSAAIYITANNALKRVPLSGAMTPVALGPTTVTGFALNALGSNRSPDDKWVIWFNMANAMVGGVNDLFVSSTQAAGNAITLDAMPDGFIFGDAFTTDSSRALFCDTLDANNSGTLKSQPLPSGAPATHSTAVWEEHAGAGTKIVISDNFTTTMVGMATIQRGDLKVLDAATNGAPKLIATQADVGEVMSTARDKVVYVWKQKQGSEGLYVAPATP